MEFLFGFIIIIGLSEMVLRFAYLKYSPFYVRLFHAFGLLGTSFYEEWRLIGSRIHRGGFTSYKQLAGHYSEISGMPIDEVKKRFRGGMPWERRIGRKFFSGAHGLFEQEISLPMGLVPVKNMNLSVFHTDSDGFRCTYDPFPDIYGEEEVETVLILGGSCVLGVGATDDEMTLPSRISYHLNHGSSRGKKYRVINAGMLGYTALQEALTLMMHRGPLDHVLVFDGLNEVDQDISGTDKSAFMLLIPNVTLKSLFFKYLRGFAIINVLVIFLTKLKQDKIPIPKPDPSSIYPHF
jgi:hypothetical protein